MISAFSLSPYKKWGAGEKKCELFVGTKFYSYLCGCKQLLRDYV